MLLVAMMVREVVKVSLHSGGSRMVAERVQLFRDARARTVRRKVAPTDSSHSAPPFQSQRLHRASLPIQVCARVPIKDPYS